MPDIAKVLKDEIKRLARKEVNAVTVDLRKATVAQKRMVAGLKRRLAQLERQAKQLAAQMAKRRSEEPVAPETAPKARISSRTIRFLRTKMRLSQAEFAKLVGVTTFAVYQWEHKTGRLRLRERTRTAVIAVRGFGAREAKNRLAEMTETKPVQTRRRGRRKKLG